jgi:Tfp pilus assembly protein PilZ
MTVTLAQEKWWNAAEKCATLYPFPTRRWPDDDRMKPRDRFFVDGVSCVVDGRSHRVANLGTGGFFAETDRPPRLGQLLVMELRLPRREGCRVVGQVSWINGHVGDRVDELPPGFGVRLTRLDRADREAIEALLKHSAPVLGPSLHDPFDA